MPGVSPYNILYRPDQVNQPLPGEELIKPRNVLGYAAGAALTGLGLGPVVAGVTAFATAGAIIGYNFLEFNRRSEAVGQAAFYEDWYKTSQARLQSFHTGLRGPVAHTMRQQTLMTLHNSAMYGRQVLGREAEILHA